tara:strand:+ start:300 stop:530 length:231 start_codon:yes stop_codon:yes gene_type:complete
MSHDIDRETGNMYDEEGNISHEWTGGTCHFCGSTENCRYCDRCKQSFCLECRTTRARDIIAYMYDVERPSGEEINN